MAARLAPLQKAQASLVLALRLVEAIVRVLLVSPVVALLEEQQTILVAVTALVPNFHNALPPRPQDSLAFDVRLGGVFVSEARATSCTSRLRCV